MKFVYTLKEGEVLHETKKYYHIKKEIFDVVLPKSEWIIVK